MNAIKLFLSENLVILGVLILWIKTIAVSLIGFSLPLQSWLDWFLLLIGPLGTLMLLLGFSFFSLKTTFDRLSF